MAKCAKKKTGNNGSASSAINQGDQKESKKPAQQRRATQLIGFNHYYLDTGERA